MSGLSRVVYSQLPGVYALAREIRNRYLVRAAREVVSRQSPPNLERPMQEFSALLNEFGKRKFTPYGFSDLENWVRATERGLWLVNTLPALQRAEAAVLEVGAGDGMLGKILAGYGHRVTLSDYEDWRDRRVRDLPLLLGKLEEGVDAPQGSFDVILSYNSFEHFEDPARCLNVLGGLLRPGGIIHLDFGPLFAGPFGMHCHTLLPIPYCQFLLEESFVLEQIQCHGHQDLGREMHTLQPMNRWRLRQFDAAWNHSGCRIVHREIFHEYAFLRLVLRFPQAFSGRQLTVDDLTAVRVQVTLEKPAEVSLPIRCEQNLLEL